MNDTPKQFIRLRDGEMMEAMQFVRYPDADSNWRVIHHWTDGLISYLGEGLSIVRSNGDPGAAETLMEPGDLRWIVKLAPGQFEVVEGDRFLALWAFPPHRRLRPAEPEVALAAEPPAELVEPPPSRFDPMFADPEFWSDLAGQCAVYRRYAPEGFGEALTLMERGARLFLVAVEGAS